MSFNVNDILVCVYVSLKLRRGLLVMERGVVCVQFLP